MNYDNDFVIKTLFINKRYSCSQLAIWHYLGVDIIVDSIISFICIL